MLDTRSFSTDATMSVTTMHVVVGGNKRLRQKGGHFAFGTSTRIAQDEVDETIKGLLHIPDENAHSSGHKYRNIILIGHGLRSDLLIMRDRGINLEEISTVVGKLDTAYLAMEILGLKLSLKGLITTLGCPSAKSHHAGNDADSALRAFLLSTYYGLRPSASSLDTTRVLDNLKNLAFDPVPDTTHRNALHRKLRGLCEDYTLHALEAGSIFFFTEH